MRTGKPYRYIVHLAICMVLVFLYFFPVLRLNWEYPLAMKWIMVRGILYGFINFHLFYILAFLVLPLHGLKKHKTAAGGALLTVLLFCLLKYAVGLLFPEQVLRPGIPLIGAPVKYFPFFTYLRYTLQTGMAVTIAAYAYYIILNWRNSDRESRMMEKAVLETSRQYERMQFSSQLLMRYLRALQQLLQTTEKRDNEGVSCILQLSELLRYMLYDRSAQQEKAGLTKELHYYKVYLDLHNRLFPHQAIQLHVKGDTAGLSIEPLLLQAATEKLLQEQGTPVTIWLYIRKNNLELSLQPESTATERFITRIKAWMPGFRALHGFKTPLYVENV